VRARGYQAREVRFVDTHGRRSGGFDVGVFGRMTHGRFTSVLRSDISAIIFDALQGRVETLFGDSVAAIDDDGQRALVRFERAPEREVDLVVGADGQHSRVRELAFGPEARYEHALGFHVAAFETQGYQPRDELTFVTYGLPGRHASRFALREDRTLFLFTFVDELLPGRPRSDAERRAALRAIYGDAGWECRAILEALDAADELYFDTVSQIRMPRWSTDRVALVGDAAACVSLLAGEGTGLAMAEAYSLAAELGDGKDIAGALERHERRMMPFLATKQASASRFAPAFAPRTAFGIGMRNLVTRLFTLPFVADYVIGRELRDDIELPPMPTTVGRARAA
jgi:2-polyprenyl-6-methoxyphenol hydroxylase-like FAD-dependent oxidoreductase